MAKPKKRPTIGRPTKLTNEIRETIVTAIQACNYSEVAAEFAGISKTTFYRWMELGERATRGPFRQFRDAIRAAEAGAEVYALASLRKAMPDTPSAAQWFLERKFQQRWGKRETVTAVVTFDHAKYLAGGDEAK